METVQAEANEPGPNPWLNVAQNAYKRDDEEEGCVSELLDADATSRTDPQDKVKRKALRAAKRKANAALRGPEKQREFEMQRMARLRSVKEDKQATAKLKQKETPESLAKPSQHRTSSKRQARCSSGPKLEAELQFKVQRGALTKEAAAAFMRFQNGGGAIQVEDSKSTRDCQMEAWIKERHGSTKRKGSAASANTREDSRSEVASASHRASAPVTAPTRHGSSQTPSQVDSTSGEQVAKGDEAAKDQHGKTFQFLSRTLMDEMAFLSECYLQPMAKEALESSWALNVLRDVREHAAALVQNADGAIAALEEVDKPPTAEAD